MSIFAALLADRAVRQTAEEAQESARRKLASPEAQRLGAIVEMTRAEIEVVTAINAAKAAASSALKPGDLAYVRGRIAKMHAYLDADRHGQVVIDRELVVLLHQHFSGGKP